MLGRNVEWIYKMTQEDASDRSKGESAAKEMATTASRVSSTCSFGSTPSSATEEMATTSRSAREVLYKHDQEFKMLFISTIMASLFYMSPSYIFLLHTQFSGYECPFSVYFLHFYLHI